MDEVDELDPRDRVVARILNETPVADDPAALQRALVAFRGSRAARRARPKLARQGVRIATVAAVSVLTGSLAAGYAAALPDPVQRAAHHILGHVGMPSPHRQRPPQRSPHRKQSKLPLEQHRVTPSRRQILVVPAPTPPILQLAGHGREAAGSTTTAVVTVDAGQLLTANRIRIQAARTRNGPWHLLLSHRVGPSGHVSLELPAFLDNTWLRAAHGHLLGAGQLLVVIPTVQAHWTKGGDGHLILHVAVRGASNGDVITIGAATSRTAGNTNAVLDRYGRATITWNAFAAGSDRWTARIDATTRHGATIVALPSPPTR